MSAADNVAISPLVAQLMTASMSQTAATTNAVIDSLTEQRDRAEAELAAIRADVESLLTGPYMPMPDAIWRALNPSDERIAVQREAGAR